MAESIAIAQAIEIAEHNRAWEGNALVVWDATKNDRSYGCRLEVEVDNRGVRAECRDRVGKCYSVWVPLGMLTRAQACQRALDGYLKILNHGI